MASDPQGAQVPSSRGQLSWRNNPSFCYAQPLVRQFFSERQFFRVFTGRVLPTQGFYTSRTSPDEAGFFPPSRSFAERTPTLVALPSPRNRYFFCSWSFVRETSTQRHRDACPSAGPFPSRSFLLPDIFFRFGLSQGCCVKTQPLSTKDLFGLIYPTASTLVVGSRCFVNAPSLPTRWAISFLFHGPTACVPLLSAMPFLFGQNFAFPSRQSLPEQCRFTPPAIRSSGFFPFPFLRLPAVTRLASFHELPPLGRRSPPTGRELCPSDPRPWPLVSPEGRGFRSALLAQTRVFCDLLLAPPPTHRNP